MARTAAAAVPAPPASTAVVAPPASTATVAPAGPTQFPEIAILDRLKNQGIISEAEYTTRKTGIIDRLLGNLATPTFTSSTPTIIALSETGEKRKSWIQSREKMLGPFERPTPSPELIAFVRQFPLLPPSCTLPEVRERFDILSNHYRHWILWICSPSPTLPDTLGEPNLIDARFVLGYLGALMYFHENQTLIATGAKKIGGVALSLCCTYSTLLEDLSAIQKSEGKDVITTIHSLISKEKKTTQNTVAHPSQGRHPVCRFCLERRGRTCTNHAENDCDLKKENRGEKRSRDDRPYRDDRDGRDKPRTEANGPSK
jgi:hypothetical protein